MTKKNSWTSVVFNVLLWCGQNFYSLKKEKKTIFLRFAFAFGVCLFVRALPSFQLMVELTYMRFGLVRRFWSLFFLLAV
jgi:hypothetical protein